MKNLAFQQVLLHTSLAPQVQTIVLSNLAEQIRRANSIKINPNLGYSVKQVFV